MLDVRNLGVRFGGIHALDDVSFSIDARRICGLIGPNGAGKTTLFNCLSRLCAWQEGSVRVNGHSLDESAPHETARLGVGRTFQNVALFDGLTVLENIRVGSHCRSRSGYVGEIFRSSRAKSDEAQSIELAHSLATDFGLADVLHRNVGELPFATRKRVELTRALASRPQLLLLDEPAAGLNHQEVEALAESIRSLRNDRGLTVLLVEHHMNLVMRVSDQVVVLNFGRVIADGLPQDVAADPGVAEAYLGKASA